MGCTRVSFLNTSHHWVFNLYVLVLQQLLIYFPLTGNLGWRTDKWQDTADGTEKPNNQEWYFFAFHNLCDSQTYMFFWGWYKTWTLDSGLDYGLDYGLDIWTGLWTWFWTGQQTNLAFPGLHSIQYLIASGLVSKVIGLYRFLRHRIQCLRPRHLLGEKLNFIWAGDWV